jgi:opacity protein-like surface antigen
MKYSNRNNWLYSQIVLLVVILMPLQLNAASNGLSLNAGMGRHLFDSSQSAADTFGMGGGIGWFFTPEWSLEYQYGRYDSEDTSQRTGAEIDVTMHQASLAYHFQRETNLLPFLSLGFAEIDIDDSSDSAVQLGGGADFYLDLARKISLRVEGAYLPYGGGDNNFYARLGVRYRLFGDDKGKYKFDLDVDGVKDSDDGCL